jgi:hypothetical protein
MASQGKEDFSYGSLSPVSPNAFCLITTIDRLYPASNFYSFLHQNV